jgi:hypothetical protein
MFESRPEFTPWQIASLIIMIRPDSAHGRCPSLWHPLAPITPICSQSATSIPSNPLIYHGFFLIHWPFGGHRLFSRTPRCSKSSFDPLRCPGMAARSILASFCPSSCRELYSKVLHFWQERPWNSFTPYLDYIIISYDIHAYTHVVYIYMCVCVRVYLFILVS